ncbi:hypothetical protein QTQ03_29705 [Micromonospora sp. WMMA1363]|uniref:hypothetical protein n=1 Tax=Micromonospora sp. WMMA1363 TaxID=3053985 RepID=UPI00259D311E|nr:hypothetical protein [Micromonospora sp. WMMA1363]MDM4723550.1 hypothetical protein [Micromonospora sp. WMMA1363]
MTDEKGALHMQHSMTDLTGKLICESPPNQVVVGHLPQPEAMVVRSMRIPFTLDEDTALAAKELRMSKTAWIRQAIEAALVARAENDQLISRAEALHALRLVRSVCPDRDLQKQEKALIREKTPDDDQHAVIEQRE